MSIYGYARVSTKEQNLDRQLLALQQYVSITDNHGFWYIGYRFIIAQDSIES